MISIRLYRARLGPEASLQPCSVFRCDFTNAGTELIKVIDITAESVPVRHFVTVVCELQFQTRFAAGPYSRAASSDRVGETSL